MLSNSHSSHFSVKFAHHINHFHFSSSLFTNLHSKPPFIHGNHLPLGRQVNLLPLLLRCWRPLPILNFGLAMHRRMPHGVIDLHGHGLDRWLVLLIIWSQRDSLKCRRGSERGRWVFGTDDLRGTSEAEDRLETTPDEPERREDPVDHVRNVDFEREEHAGLLLVMLVLLKGWWVLDSSGCPRIRAWG